MQRLPEWCFEKADVEHADALAAAIDDGFIARHIMIIDHESGAEPDFSLFQHAVANRR